MVGRPAAVRQSKNMAKPQDPRVPRSVEEYLIERAAYLSERGAGIGGAVGGASGTGAARAGERGGRRNAQRAHTVVEERAGSVALTGEQVRERIISAAPRAKRPPATHVLRWAVPVGTGIRTSSSMLRSRRTATTARSSYEPSAKTDCGCWHLVRLGDWRTSCGQPSCGRRSSVLMSSRRDLACTKSAAPGVSPSRRQGLWTVQRH